MKLKVKKMFIDKYTDKLYKENDIITVTEKRGEELLKSPYNLVEEVKTSGGQVQTKADKESENKA